MKRIFKKLEVTNTKDIANDSTNSLRDLLDKPKEKTLNEKIKLINGEIGKKFDDNLNWLKINKESLEKIGVNSGKLLPRMNEWKSIKDAQFYGDPDAEQVQAFFELADRASDIRDQVELRSINVRKFIKNNNITECIKRVVERSTESFGYLQKNAKHVSNTDISFLDITAAFGNLTSSKSHVSMENGISLYQYNNISKEILRAEKKLRDVLMDPFEEIS